MQNLLPDTVVNRKKMGFVLPWKEWLKNELHDFCLEQINGLEVKGLYKKNAITGIWQDFLSASPLINWSRIWHLVVLNYWLDKNKIEQ